MTETMLVRAVKAVETELGKQEMVLTDPLTLRRMMATRAVRAALQAIKEPDDGMEEAGFTALKAEQNAATPGGTCAVVFTAMIDSVLSKSQEGKHP
jgi:hypothetical protein